MCSTVRWSGRCPGRSRRVGLRLAQVALDERHRAVEQPAERSGKVLEVEILAGGASTGRGIRQSGKQRPPSQGVGSATPQRGGPNRGPRRDTGAPLPLSPARTRPGGPREAARRPDGTTTMGHESSLGSGLGGRRQRSRARCGQDAASQGGIHLDSEETAGSPITCTAMIATGPGTHKLPLGLLP